LNINPLFKKDSVPGHIYLDQEVKRKKEE